MDVANPRSKWATLRLLYREIEHSGLFDASWYRRQGGLARVFPHPLTHYLLMGWRHGLNPSPRFDTSHYLRSYRDVRESDANPLVHYVLHGHEEGRLPTQSAKALRESLHPEAAHLPLFEVPGQESSRLSVVIDDNTPRLQVLGYVPVVTLALYTARVHGLTVRIVVRSDVISHEDITSAVHASGLTERPPLDIIRRSPGDTADVDELHGERWWACSHSAYLSLSGQVPPTRLTWMMVADEEARAPQGEERLRIRSLLHDPSVNRVDLSDLPPLPSLLPLPPHPSPTPGPTVLGVVCDPLSPDSLLARSLLVVEEALAQGILSASDWVIRILGPDLRPVTLTGSVVPESTPLRDLRSWIGALADTNVVVALSAGGEPPHLIDTVRRSGRPVVDGVADDRQATLEDLRGALSGAGKAPRPPEASWEQVVAAVSAGWERA